jgi:hypothetical protein
VQYGTLAVGVAFTITVLRFVAKRSSDPDLGTVSQSWITQHRASTNGGLDR